MLTFGAAKTVVNSFVVVLVYRYNSLLADVPEYLLDRFQSVLNAEITLWPPAVWPHYTVAQRHVALVSGSIPHPV